jgi:ABC-type nitrate/sulfonate/bicarbonate transport system substrate-binding protein
VFTLTGGVDKNVPLCVQCDETINERLSRRPVPEPEPNRLDALFEEIVENWESCEADTEEADEFYEELFQENPRRPSWKATLEDQFLHPTTLTDDEAEALTLRLREAFPRQ